MADKTDAEKAEKLAAAKKRFEELKKEKQKGNKGDSDKSKAKKADGDKDKNKKVAAKKKKPAKAEDKGADAEKPAEKSKERPTDENEEKGGEDNDEIDDEYKEAAQDGEDSNTEEHAEDEATESKDTVPEPETPSATKHTRQPSLSIQSRMRSDSFRKGTQASPRSPSSTSKGQSLPALTADGDSMNEIYRKQTARLEELEKENRQLSKDAETAQARQERMDVELEELRENASQATELKSRADKAAAKDEEIMKLKTENASLQRQNVHLQSSAQKSSRKDASSPAAQPSSPGPADLLAQLESKSSTIESMELEISNLRAQVTKSSSSDSGHAEQITALEEKAARAERAAGAAQRELQDARKGLERASEKAVREGTERTSAEIQIRTLERELADSKSAHEEAKTKAEQVQSKLVALTTLHKDTDARRQSNAKELAALRTELESTTNEATRLRAQHAKRNDGTGATDDEGLDELEDEARAALQARVRDLEAELFELRRGAWRDRRRELQEGNGTDEVAVLSPRGAGPNGGGGTGFDEVDLMGGGGGERRGSAAPSPPARRTSSFKTVFTSGIKAFRSDGDGAGAGDGLLADDDDADLDFDENAFRQAQEDDAKRRLERVRELKRGLVAHSGFRVDLVELRRSGGGGLGEIFEV